MGQVLEDAGLQSVHSRLCSKSLLPSFPLLLTQDTFTALSLARFLDAPSETHMSFSPCPNILPKRSNGFRKGLLARMLHRVFLLGKNFRQKCV